MEEILFTKEEQELIDLIKYFRDMVLINEETPPYNRLILQEEIDYLNSEITTIIQFAKGKTEYRKAKELEHYNKWNTKIDQKCPWCKKMVFSNALGEIKMDDGFTYSQYFCPSCHMNFEGSEPNNNNDMILFTEKFLAEMLKKGKGGRVNYEINGISFEQMKKRRANIEGLKEKVKKSMKENKEIEEANNEFMAYVLNELIRLRIAKKKFITENDIQE
jgi:hypothetical protein